MCVWLLEVKMERSDYKKKNPCFGYFFYLERGGDTGFPILKSMKLERWDWEKENMPLDKLRPFLCLARWAATAWDFLCYFLH